MNMRDGKVRFTDRVVEYLKYRPSYPNEVVALIDDRVGLAGGAAIADIGAGTGIFSRQLLNAGYEVFAVEPNHAMRQAAECMLLDYETFHCIAGSAEDTELPDRQVELVTVAQAFHWFDVEQSRREFIRITRSPHPALLVWNHRQTGRKSASELNDPYDKFLQQWCDDYEGIRANCHCPDRLTQFFGATHKFEKHVFQNCQVLNWDALEGRVKSCSYTPRPDDPRYVPMICDLRELFDRYEIGGRVKLCYDTNVFLGELLTRSSTDL